MTTYVFDTSAFIEGWVRSYPPQSFPNLWANLDQLACTGRLIAPEEALEELKARDDELLARVKQRGIWIIQPTSRELMLELRRLLATYPLLTKGG